MGDTAVTSEQKSNEQWPGCGCSTVTGRCTGMCSAERGPSKRSWTGSSGRHKGRTTGRKAEGASLSYVYTVLCYDPVMDRENQPITIHIMNTHIIDKRSVRRKVSFADFERRLIAVLFS